jgi:hypothetical protein
MVFSFIFWVKIPLLSLKPKTALTGRGGRRGDNALKSFTPTPALPLQELTVGHNTLDTVGDIYVVISIY